METKNFKQAPYLRNFICGFADGLTVPLPLIVGSSSLKTPRSITIAGLAELFSSSVSIGMCSWKPGLRLRLMFSFELGAYLATVAGGHQYPAQLKYHQDTFVKCPKRRYGCCMVFSNLVAYMFKGFF